jgi:lipoprotein-anchoring transpeptidase ErfK/SrfK
LSIGRAIPVLLSLVAAAAAVPSSNAQAKVSACANALGSASVTGPTPASSWRAALAARAAVYDRVPAGTRRPVRRLSSEAAPWLLVLQRPRVAAGRCWVKVRLPWRPNDAAGWVDAAGVLVQQNRWRIEISTAKRRLTLVRSGRPVQTMSAVVGTASTPTPSGLFAVTVAIRWHPEDFLGSWVLELTAHSNVLQRFDGGDGTVGIHGRGGSSLLDPLGSARSHGCVRLSNDSIDRLVRTIGAAGLPGTPVQIT